MNNVQETKIALALSTKRGIPLILAGILFWVIAGVSGAFLPQRIAVFVYLFGVGLVFPLGILISKIMKIDLFANENPLGALAGLIAGMQVLFAPIIIMLYFLEPDGIPFALGVLTGAHFLPYTWIYNSKAYLFLSISTVITASIVGTIFQNAAFVLTPFAIAVIYILTVVGLWKESGNDTNWRGQA